MNILVNCSNLKAGGGLQVADSICGQLRFFEQHHFIVVLSPFMDATMRRLVNVQNVNVFVYKIPNSFKTIVQRRDDYLDNLIESEHIQAVLTVFGPSRWAPKVSHLSGFAMPHLVIPESPYFIRMNWLLQMKWKLWCHIRKLSFKYSASYFWTENPFISERLEKLLPNKKVYTVSNYYNQIYDQTEKWSRLQNLPSFDGITCLSISTHYPHKNFEIIIDVVRVIKETIPNFKVRFVLTFEESQMRVPDDIKDYIVFVGSVDVSECPYLYQQCDIMFMPTLLECFTATYPEAMRMEKPIVTTDLEFARGLCGDAACYYSAVDAKAAAEAIYKVATDKSYSELLVENGKNQLLKYDNYEQRTEKLIRILEEIAK